MFIRCCSVFCVYFNPYFRYQASTVTLGANTRMHQCQQCSNPRHRRFKSLSGGSESTLCLFVTESSTSYHGYPCCVCRSQLLWCGPHSWFWISNLKDPKAAYSLLWIWHHEIYEGGVTVVFLKCSLYSEKQLAHLQLVQFYEYWCVFFSLLQNSYHDLNHEAEALRRLEDSGAILYLHPHLWYTYSTQHCSSLI